MQAEFKEVEADFKKIKMAFLPIFTGNEVEDQIEKAKLLVFEFIKKYTKTDSHVQLLGYYNAAFDKLGPKAVYGIISSVFETLSSRKS